MRFPLGLVLAATLRQDIVWNGGAAVEKAVLAGVQRGDDSLQSLIRRVEQSLCHRLVQLLIVGVFHGDASTPLFTTQGNGERSRLIHLACDQSL
jgi:hypothetical protein